jgi:hypothetical protein
LQQPLQPWLLLFLSFHRKKNDLKLHLNSLPRVGDGFCCAKSLHSHVPDTRGNCDSSHSDLSGTDPKRNKQTASIFFILGSCEINRKFCSTATQSRREAGPIR